MPLVFVSEVPDSDPQALGVGRGRPGQLRPGANQTPTERQPNRGRKPGDPFTCAGCRKIFPEDEEHFLGKVPQGRCIPCGRELASERTARHRSKQRGPDYVLPGLKSQTFPVVDGSRECSLCGELKFVGFFHKDRTVSSGYMTVCKSCRAVQRRVHWEELSEEQRLVVRAEAWRRWIWRRFWITPEAYAAMLAAQDGKCAICKQISDRRLCVDHDHSCCPTEYTCGKCVRQLLCHLCNFTIGAIEQVGSVDPFAEYLSRHPKTLVSV